MSNVESLFALQTGSTFQFKNISDTILHIFSENKQQEKTKTNHYLIFKKYCVQYVASYYSVSWPALGMGEI